MMNTSTHYENAHFLRELAELLPSISLQKYKPEQVQLLQRLADEEPGMTTEQVRSMLNRRYEELRDAV